jgi:hypothetical protein|tara:strand:- start:140 stop:277 length:138 start_codon:yes stop_codon:yes gene_type:complete
MIKNFGEMQYEEGFPLIQNKIVSKNFDHDTEDLIEELGDIQFEST